MDKFLIIFGSFTFSTLIFIAISCVINFCFIKRIKKISGLKNLIFGLQITLIGMVVFYIIFNYTFYNIFWSIAMYFVPICILTTGFTLSLIIYYSTFNKQFHYDIIILNILNF